MPGSISLVPINSISKKIFFMREEKVMLDKDIAFLYGVRPIALRQQVKRNIERFPADFMFQLTETEADSLVSQNVIPSRKQLGGALPYAFTEQGIAMLSGVLNSKKAILVNVQIMRAFSYMRKMLLTHRDLQQKIDALEKKYDDQFRIVFDAIRQLLEPTEDKKKKRYGFLADRS
jgi:hypothetical protein